jgi:hypothetical protein
MARTEISSTDLIALFSERLRDFSDCPNGLAIAIVPTDANNSGWTAVTNPGSRSRYPLCINRIEAIEKQLRKIYVLAKDRARPPQSAKS